MREFPFINIYEGEQKMKNNETLLLNLLNKVFGFPDARAASYKKIKQYYDERKSQHVVLIELRVSRGEKAVSFSPDNNKTQRLLYQVLNMKANNKKKA